MALDKNDLWEGSSSPRIVAYFVRHGETALNNEKRFRGPLDPPLDENGLADAHKAADFFSGIELGSAFSSDKQRAETTAQAILQPKGMNYTSDPNLRAWNVGYMAGQKKSDLKDDIEYFQRHPDEQIPNGESLNQFRDRIRPSLLNSIQSGVSEGKPSLTTLHSSGIKEVSNIIHGDHNHTQVYPGGIAAVYHDPTAEDGKKFFVKAITKEKKGAAKREGYGQ